MTYEAAIIGGAVVYGVVMLTLGRVLFPKTVIKP